MGHSEFEHILCEHCAPVLLGCKVANLVAIEREPDEPVEPFLDRYRCIFAAKNIRIRMLCQGAHRCQLLLYCPNRLSQLLQTDSVQTLLIKSGYPAGASLDCCLDILSHRMSVQGDFPHEIGLFLGYPPEDVKGFQENAGKNYLFFRYWKVYTHPEEASQAFERFDRCRSYMCSRLREGLSLSQILDLSYGAERVYPVAI